MFWQALPGSVVGVRPRAPTLILARHKSGLATAHLAPDHLSKAVEKLPF